jgi:hypothetical protein
VFQSATLAGQCLSDILSPILEKIRKKEVGIGRSLDIDVLLQEEVNLGLAKIGVVVCGPAGMCSDVGAVVV